MRRSAELEEKEEDAEDAAAERRSCFLLVSLLVPLVQCNYCSYHLFPPSPCSSQNCSLLCSSRARTHRDDLRSESDTQHEKRRLHPESDSNFWQLKKTRQQN